MKPLSRPPNEAEWVSRSQEFLAKNLQLAEKASTPLRSLQPMAAFFRARVGAAYGYDIVRSTLGLILLAAAFLKAYQLATVPLAGSSICTSHWFQFAIIEFEPLLGVWLVTGLYQAQARHISIACSNPHRSSMTGLCSSRKSTTFDDITGVRES